MQSVKRLSVLDQLDTAHQQQVAHNQVFKDYFRFSFVLFSPEQNIAQRGHEEGRTNLGQISGTNRGNFSEFYIYVPGIFHGEQKNETSVKCSSAVDYPSHSK